MRLSDALILLPAPPESSFLYTGIYDPKLVVLSVFIAIFASLAALDVADRALRRGEQAQDGAAVRLGDDGERRFHARYIPSTAYSCQGLFGERSLRWARDAV